MPPDAATLTDPKTGNARVPYTRETGNHDADHLARQLHELREEFQALPEWEQRTAEDNERLGRLVAEARRLDAELTAVLALERIEARARGDEPGAGDSRPAAATWGGLAGTEYRTGAEVLMQSEAVQAWLSGGMRADGFAVELPFGIDAFPGLQQRAVITEWSSGGPPNYDATGAGNLLPVGQPIPPIPRQAKLYLRDLIPKMSTSLAAVPYVQELNPTANEAASAVAEGGTKPSANIAFQGAKADPTVIAATLTISKQLWEDAPLVVQYINGRLPYIVRFKEDAEFLNGSGTWPDIQGILQNANILSQAATAGEYAITLGQAFAQIENHDGQVTAVVFNPTDAWAMFTKRAASGSGTFDAGTPFSALPLTVWGVPTYRTRAKAAGSALCADFDRGATIVDREQVNVQTYRERYAELNEILLICEERVGLMIQRPDLFCNTTLA